MEEEKSLNARPRLDKLAERLETKMTWDDLVLPEEETRMLHQIADQVMQAEFSGVHFSRGYPELLLPRSPSETARPIARHSP